MGPELALIAVCSDPHGPLNASTDRHYNNPCGRVMGPTL